MVPSLESLSVIDGVMWIVPISVLVASLIGSPHCVMMCGPLVMNFASNRRRMIGYQLGRMISYTGAGALAGALGQSILSASRLPWVTSLSLGLIAIFLIITGYRTLIQKPLHLPLPQFMTRPLFKIWSRLRSSRAMPADLTAGLAGLLTLFLPCGHLYGFLVGAMATGGATKGAAFMMAFWLGTVPALGFGASWLRKWLQPGLSKRPQWAGALLILAGFFSLYTFASNLKSLDHAAHPSVQEKEAPSCH